MMRVSKSEPSGPTTSDCNHLVTAATSPRWAVKDASDQDMIGR